MAKSANNNYSDKEQKKPSLCAYLFYYNGSLSLFSIALICITISFLLCFLTMVFSYICAIIILFGIPFSLYVTLLDYSSALSLYKQKHNNWVNAKNSIDGKYNKQNKNNASQYTTYEIVKHSENTKNSVTKCPRCGSTSITYIPMMWVTSTDMLDEYRKHGNHGTKYVCRNCKHNW